MQEVFPELFARVQVFPCEIGDLSACHFRPDREALSVRNEVDFGREATF